MPRPAVRQLAAARPRARAQRGGLVPVADRLVADHDDERRRRRDEDAHAEARAGGHGGDRDHEHQDAADEQPEVERVELPQQQRVDA